MAKLEDAGRLIYRSWHHFVILVALPLVLQERLIRWTSVALYSMITILFWNRLRWIVLSACADWLVWKWLVSTIHLQAAKETNFARQQLNFGPYFRCIDRTRLIIYFWFLYGIHWNNYSPQLAAWWISTSIHLHFDEE